MVSKFSVLSLLLLILFSVQTVFANETVETLARKAVSENTAESAVAIEQLRWFGPAGLETLKARYADEIKRHIADPTLPPDPEWQRITKALDTVSGQKNSYLSGLYWYTDLKEARKAAAESGKPILSLRLLGKLTDELSCANSRFFRTVLYSNAEIASFLGSRFVLHWQSVRPAPVITIDFGDGRKLERTITGNSIHYVLDHDGRPFEALPGLYGPKAFLRILREAEGLFKSMAGKNEHDRNVLILNYYGDHLRRISVDFYEDTIKIGGKTPVGWTVQRGPDGKIQAIRIAQLAVTKAMTELDFLRAVSPASEALGRMTDEAAWLKIAQLRLSDAVLDARSLALMKQQNPALSQKEFSAMLQKFQESIALDTVRNEYLMHGTLYSWLSINRHRTDLEKFNEKVYAELFLTPRSDQWLGLFTTDVYTALDNGGIR